MNTEIVVGLLVGIIIGLVSSVVAVILIKTMVDASNKSLSSLLKIIGQFLAIPVFMVGGPWASGVMLKQLITGPNLVDFVVGFLLTATPVFVGIVAFPIWKLTLRMATEIGESIGPSHE